MNILAIDPGPVESAIVLWDGGSVLHAEILPNDALLEKLRIQFANCCVTRDNYDNENAAPNSFEEPGLLLEKQGATTDLHEAEAGLESSKNSEVSQANKTEKIEAAQKVETEESETFSTENEGIQNPSPRKDERVRKTQDDNAGAPSKVQSLQSKLEQEEPGKTAAVPSGTPGKACDSQHADGSGNTRIAEVPERGLPLLPKTVFRQGALGSQDAPDSRRQQHGGERGAGLPAMQSFQGAQNRIGISVAIEMMQCMGMPVGKEVFETCLMIGRMQEIILQAGVTVRLVFRREVKMHLCGNMRAKDANIRQALIDRFGPVGTKKAPGKLYGVSSHLWAALAVAVTAMEITGQTP